MPKKNWFYINAFFRILTPFLIYFNPWAGIIIPFVLDIYDGDLAAWCGFTKKTYQHWDKALDLWWLLHTLIFSFIFLQNYFIFLFILFIYRLAGYYLFFTTNKRYYFVYFSNFYECAFLLIFIGSSIQKLNFLVTPPYLYIYLITLFLGKVLQEWYLHYADRSLGEDLLKRPKNWKKE